MQTGVWNLINLWVKTSRDDGNVAFLMDLLKLLYDLPMTIGRLRENECPKIIKKLCKHDNEEIALKANQIIKKWTKIIHVYSEKAAPSGDQNGGSAAVNSNSSNMKAEKKRKLESASTAAASSGESSKKAKSSPSSAKAESPTSATADKTNELSNSNQSGEPQSSVDDADQYEAFSREDMNKFLVTKSDLPKEQPKAARPVTVKVKPGKFRLDLSATSSPQPGVKIKKKTDLKDSKATLDAKNLKLPLKKLPPLSGNGTIKIPPVPPLKIYNLQTSPTTTPVVLKVITEPPLAIHH